MTVTRYLRGGGGSSGSASKVNIDDKSGGWVVFLVIVLWAVIAYPQVFCRVITDIVCCLPTWVRRRYRKYFKCHQTYGNRQIVPSVRHKISKNPIR